MEPKGTIPNGTQSKALSAPEYGQKVLEELHSATVLSTLAGEVIANELHPGGFKLYRDALIKAVGQPVDPLENLIIDQLLWAHFSIGRLQTTAAGAATAEVNGAFTLAITRLMAEFRKTLLALREYRSPLTPRQITVVQQQNVAAQGDQQIAFVERGGGPTNPPPVRADIELVSNPQTRVIDHVEQPKALPTPARRPPQPVQARRPHPARPATPPRRNPAPPPMAIRDGSEDGDGEDEICE